MTQSAPEKYTQSIAPSSGKSFSFGMIPIEGGSFMMGGSDDEELEREKTIHRVELSSFWMGEFPVTQALWQAVLGENPSTFPGLDRPVESVSWLDSTKRFLPALNNLCGKNYRLPTEAEWEYAARGGNHHSSFLYSGSNRLGDVAWYAENSHDETKAAGLKQPNALGLYDLSGNVYEWCADWYDENYYQTCVEQQIVKNPTGPEKGQYRVLRGGSWNLNNPRYCRVSDRYLNYPVNAFNYVGFRLVLSVLQ